MIPYPSKSLHDLAVRLATHGIAEAKTEFGQAEAGILSSLLMTLAEDFERNIANRMDDIEQLKKLFIQAKSAAAIEPELLTNISAFAQAYPQSFHLAEVNRVHAQGFVLLTRLHSWAELNNEELNMAIWQLLRAHSERNKFSLPGP